STAFVTATFDPVPRLRPLATRGGRDAWPRILHGKPGGVSRHAGVAVRSPAPSWLGQAQRDARPPLHSGVRAKARAVLAGAWGDRVHGAVRGAGAGRQSIHWA